MDVIYGINTVREALRSRGRSFEYVAVSRDRHDARLHSLINDCRAAGVPLRQLSRQDLDRLTDGKPHQGAVAVVSQKKYSDLDDLLSTRRSSHALLVVLDGIEDPHNLGAILRTADAVGADGVVIPERRAVGVTGAVAKASAGAFEHLPVARVTNIGRAIEELKARNVWTVGLDERAPQTYDALDYSMDCGLVLGAEGKGLHEQVRKKCDYLISIPMLGKVPSLNVSVAAAVVLYEVVRQRRNAHATSPSQPKDTAGR